MNLDAPSVLQSMIVQITASTPSSGSERQQERMEVELIATLGRNVTIEHMIAATGFKRCTITKDMARLENQGYVSSWTIKRFKWFGLAPKGVARAKILREMQ